MNLLFESVIPTKIAAFLTANPYRASIFNICAVFLIAWLLKSIIDKLLATVVAFAVKKTKTKWDDILLKHKVFSKAAMVVPAIVVYWFAPIFRDASLFLKKLAFCFLVFVVLGVARAISDALMEIYDSFEISKEKPLKSLAQVIIVLLYCIGAIVVVSIFVDKSPALLLSGLGAMSAVIMLIFRDTILGFVAGFQIITNRSIKKGDWIVMPQYNADGEVLDIALHSVQIQNWDKSIVTVPTHKFIEESFINWRGMSEAGGRRICRNLTIDVSTIRFLNRDDVEKLNKINLLRDYLTELSPKLENLEKGGSNLPEALINGESPTNIALFRIYITRYLLNNDSLRHDLTLMTRQLQPNENGLPLQIYVFTKSTEWVVYETIQAEIFDHLLASADYFGLRIYQKPSEYDLKILNEKIGEISNADCQKVDKNT